MGVRRLYLRSQERTKFSEGGGWGEKHNFCLKKLKRDYFSQIMKNLLFLASQGWARALLASPRTPILKGLVFLFNSRTLNLMNRIEIQTDDGGHLATEGCILFIHNNNN